MSTTYSESHRKYYQEHKQEIREKRKTVDKAYYERHKEAIRAKNLARYHDKKTAASGTPPPASSPPVSSPPASSGVNDTA